MKSFNEWRFEQTIEEIIQSNINMARQMNIQILIGLKVMLMLKMHMMLV